MDLFDTHSAPKPLAAALRPKTLNDVVGQEHLTHPDSALQRRIRAGQLGSAIFYGPPGVGKTSIARAIGGMCGKEFRPLHATRAGVKDIRALADEARTKDILIFVDEVHRFSATQIDDLLSITEEGTADFVGATTQNPYHALPPALISRSTIYKLEPVSEQNMLPLLEKALSHLNSKSAPVNISKEQLLDVGARSGGDLRRALTTLETLCLGHTKATTITDQMLFDAYQAAAVRHDRQGDQHYDITSAFIKSMRGSDPDATLYWLARLIHAGEDPRFIARRIMIHASEDIGLADNTALQTAVAAADAVAKIGYPEAQIILAHAALHVARAPKSNSAHRGISLAMQMVQNEAPIDVPPHLRDTHYKGAQKLGHVGYQFPHDHPKGWVNQDYAPGLARGSLYQSDAREAPTFEQRADVHWDYITQKPTPRTQP